MQYYGTKLTENISRREPEGYLLCLNVPVARTGVQEYLPEELGLPGTDPVPVFRSEAEVFSPETIASFEGMPVTNDHPADGVDIDNIRRLQAGHAHNIRRGTGDESDLLLADLIITDPRLIEAILAGKREISCGYTYELQEENGQYLQRKIRGNHIAVVDAGRAGPRVSIKDEQAYPTHFERRNNMKKSLAKLLARMAKDGGAETVAEFIEEMMENKPDIPDETAEAAEEAAGTEETVTVAVPEDRGIVIDEEAFASVIERLDRLIALLTPAEAAADENPAEEVSEIVEEVLEAAQAGGEEKTPVEEVAEIVGSILEPEVSTAIGEEKDCGSQDPAVNRDAMRAALLVFRPVLARMTPAQRRKTCADIAANLRASRRSNDAGIYASLAAGVKPAAVDFSDLGSRIMASRNPCYNR